ncbi:MAG: UbiA family prenyltransferase [Planctomycetota bacterium]
MAQPSSTLRAYLQLVRLPNLFTAMADVTMGFLFTHAVFGRGDGWVFAFLLAASSLLYAAGVTLNDVFDFQIDARERPHRPLPSGRIPLAAARWLGWELLLIGVALAWTAAFLADDLRPGVVATFLAGSIVLYNGLVKRTPLGPPAMGACRMLNVLLGMSVAAVPWQDEHWTVAASIGTYIVGVTWFARTEAGRSSRWHLGLATAVILLGIGMLWQLPGRCDRDRVVLLLQQEPGRFSLLIAVLALLIGFRCLRAVVEPVPHRVQTAVKQCILSLVILDATACFVVRDVAGAVIVLLLLVPTVILGRWIEST